VVNIYTGARAAVEASQAAGTVGSYPPTTHRPVCQRVAR
jgi:hypothetical protein